MTKPLNLDPRGGWIDAIRVYQDRVLGRRSLAALLKYELLGVWGATVPGAAGLALRRLLWRWILARAGRATVFGRHVTLRHPGKMWIGDAVLVDDDTYLDAAGCGEGEFRIEERSLISRGCIVSAQDGPLRIGEGANIGAGSFLYAYGGLEIGKDTLIAANCYIGGGRYDHRGRLAIPMSQQPLAGRGVIIGDECWLGAGVVVIDGVRIGRGCVIGAGAVVTSAIPPHTIAGGVPARGLGTRKEGPPARG